MVSDARLLANYFDKLAGPISYSDEQSGRCRGSPVATLTTTAEPGASRWRITGPYRRRSGTTR
jgi:hypothetical protein